MASYFVSKLGSNANNGTTWALAKLTIAAGFALCSGAGDILYVAPGRYCEQNVAPASAGSRATKKSWIGDWDSTVQDGEGNTSGVAPGFIYCDATKQTATTGFSTTTQFMAISNAWAYWNVKNVYVTGGYYGFITYPSTGVGTIPNDGVTYENIIGEAWVDKGIQIGGWTMDSDTGASITVNNCIGITRITNATYGGGLYADNTSVTLRTNPNIIYNRCISIGSTNGVVMYAANANRMRVTFNNCTIVSTARADSTYVVHNPGNDGTATYGVFTFNDCYLEGYKASLTVGVGASNSVFNRCKFYLSDAETVQTSESCSALMPMINTLYPGSSLVDANGANGVFPDIWGNAVSGNADFGAQEMQSNQYLYPPNMRLRKV